VTGTFSTRESRRQRVHDATRVSTRRDTPGVLCGAASGRLHASIRPPRRTCGPGDSHSHPPSRLGTSATTAMPASEHVCDAALSDTIRLLTPPISVTTPGPVTPSPGRARTRAVREDGRCGVRDGAFAPWVAHLHGACASGPADCAPPRRMQRRRLRTRRRTAASGLRARPHTPGRRDVISAPRPHTCRAGLCVDPHQRTARDQCHGVGFCDPTTGAARPAADGIAADDGQFRRGRHCLRGVCRGYGARLPSLLDACKRRRLRRMPPSAL